MTSSISTNTGQSGQESTKTTRDETPVRVCIIVDELSKIIEVVSEVKPVRYMVQYLGRPATPDFYDANRHPEKDGFEEYIKNINQSYSWRDPAGPAPANKLEAFQATERHLQAAMMAMLQLNPPPYQEVIGLCQYAKWAKENVAENERPIDWHRIGRAAKAMADAASSTGEMGAPMVVPVDIFSEWAAATSNLTEVLKPEKE